MQAPSCSAQLGPTPCSCPTYSLLVFDMCLSALLLLTYSLALSGRHNKSHHSKRLCACTHALSSSIRRTVLRLGSERCIRWLKKATHGRVLQCYCNVIRLLYVHKEFCALELLHSCQYLSTIPSGNCGTPVSLSDSGLSRLICLLCNQQCRRLLDLRGL